MPLVPTASLVQAAHEGRYGVGAFNVVHLEHAEAHVTGAEEARAGVILQISENAVRWHGRLAPLARAALAVAETARVPVAVHLDHATEPDLVDEAIALGFGSVMYDGSKLPWEQNLATTREVVAGAAGREVWVEAELGEVGGKDGVHAPGVRTDPDEARRFVEMTGVDGLAVAVGTSHAMTTRTAELDLDLIAALRKAAGVPLVLHGSSGVPDEELTRAVEAGMTKINIATHLNKVFTASVRDTLAAQPDLVDTRKYVGPARQVMASEVARLLEVLQAAERVAMT
ncbi:ketose-bisphosphate aldolase [Egicoccus sp. AB-alg2]|uniref:class II fructose-bisphosphate aldolase n=1 Tax=Egicoccus sp. AB-alg2 TaxID=3242693 RepID=UPI00359E9BF1